METIIEAGESGAGTPYRATYEFYEPDGTTRFVFKDAAGNDQTSQILKDGEVLEDVGIPKSASQNAKFVGWYDEDGNKVEVDEAKSVTANKTIKLTARMQGIINAFFVTAIMKDDQGQDMSRSVVKIKQIEYTVGQSEAITVDTSDITTEAPTSEQAVVGWNRNETEANAGTVETTNGIITLYEDGNVDPITDVMIFPAVQNAYWLYFDENDGGTGGGASYTPPQFVTIGGKPTEPTAPHRTGYSFGGWFKDQACTDPFDFNQEMTASTTIYAKWTGARTTYTVIVKVQSSSDSAKITNSNNLSHADKSYDYWKSYTIDANTGDTATVAQTYKNLANQIDSTGYITYETCDPDTTVNADGSTVLYAYYQRRVMTIHWKRSTNANASDSATWYGLYGASFSESNKTWLEPENGYRWRTSAIYLTFMDAFKNFNPAGANLTIYYAFDTDSSYDIYFYIENLDGTWKLDHQFEFNTTSFQFSQKYEAFTLSQYSRNNSTWNTATAGSSVNRNNQNLYVRYTRNSYDITFHNGALGTDGTVVRTDSIKYDTPLAGHETPTVSYPVPADADHYDFIGWFTDSGWKTMVTFSELDEQTKENYRNWYGVVEFVVINNMPAHNIALYAGYALKGWDCALDPNGGEFTSATQAGVFWLSYGQSFSSDIKTNIVREGYVFQGWMVASVEGDLNVTYKNNLRYISDDSNWTMSDVPWQFETGITGPTYLMAKWFYKTSLSVQYDANGGSNAPVDEGSYSDHATTVAFRAPIAPENYNFLGWDIEGTSALEKLKPGDSFEVSSDYAVNDVVTLKAVYSSPGSPDEVPVTHITWYDNFTENPVENTNYYTNNELKINEDVDIMPADTFTREGYTFIGWARVETTDTSGKPISGYKLEPRELGEEDLYLKYVKAEGTIPAHFETTDGHKVEKVAADENYPYHDLYAVWKTEFYVFHSGVDGGNLETYYVEDYPTFDLTSVVTENTLYGGYYLENGFTMPGDKAAYDGNNWIWTTPQTVSGKAITPKAGETYYIKEVPSSYMNPNLYVTWDTYHNVKVTNGKTGYKLISMFLMTVVDDANYNEVGYGVNGIKNITSETSGSDKDALTETFTITKEGQPYQELTSQSVFKLSGLLLLQQKDGYIMSNAQFQDVPYWITPDNVTVTGATQLKGILGNAYYYEWQTPGIRKTSSSVNITIQ